jgi:PAS domain S-box-containing protein
MGPTVEPSKSNRTEKQIQAQTDFISRVLDASPDIIHITNISSNTTVYINKMLLNELGYDSNDIRAGQLGANVEQLYHPDDIEHVAKFRDDISKSADDEIVEMEARLKAKNGSWQWFRTRAKVFKRDDDGGVEKYIGLSQNITTTKALENEKKQNAILREMNRLKTDFFSSASHEFRTPLSLLLAPLQDVLSDEKGKPSPRHVGKLQMAYRNALRLLKLVNTQLDFATIEAGKMEAVFQPTDISKFTKDLASNFRSLIESAGLKYIVKCEDADEPIYLSRDMWEKIVLNLISNAFKFTFSGKIEVLLRDNKKHIQLHVRDTGVGIAQDDLPRIFERFTRIENVKSRAFQGTGIGLTLVKELVALHGGSIKVTSTPGAGTRFIIVIPKGKSHLPQKQIHEFKEASDRDTYASLFIEEAGAWSSQESDRRNKKRIATTLREARPGRQTILIADDNPDMLNYLEEILSNEYTVITVENGRKALEIIEAGLRPDLILSDIMMPENDGMDFLRTVRKKSEFAKIPFVFLSAKSTEDSKILALQNGASDYIVKPFLKSELLSRLKAHLEAKR